MVSVLPETGSAFLRACHHVDKQMCRGCHRDLGEGMYAVHRLTSGDGDVEFVFQHNVCGRSIYAEGTVDAALFLAKKVAEGSEQHIFDMIDVLKAGAMR